MHELSIAYDLVELAVNAAQQAHANRVERVHMKLGVFASVVKETLLFGYDVATKGTLLEGSHLETEDVPLVIYCPKCACERELVSIQAFRCPMCDAPVDDIRHGQELELTSMEII